MTVKADLASRLSGAPSSRGKTALLKHWKGEHLTQRQAILAKCCDCTGYHVDGRLDCRVAACALYPWMPFRDDRKRPRSTSGNASHGRPSEAAGRERGDAAGAAPGPARTRPAVG